MNVFFSGFWYSHRMKPPLLNVQLAVSGGALAESSRYIQYVLQESTTNTAQTPAVKDVVIAFNR